MHEIPLKMCISEDSLETCRCDPVPYTRKLSNYNVPSGFDSVAKQVLHGISELLELHAGTYWRLHPFKWYN